MHAVKVVTIALALGLLLPCAASAAAPWPPVEGPGNLFVHYGEEHWNDDDGLTLLPKVVEGSARYKPALVTMSGDKDNDGDVGQLTKWREIMSAYDRAGIPYFAGVGNHDRQNAPANQPGFPPGGDLNPYKQVFAERPWPFGDAKPYDKPGFEQRSRPADDPPGAASHYFVDYANVRWIFVDNSCWSIINCDPLQNPADGDTRPQLAWLRDRAQQATDAGKVVFVVMHMPTRDPRDQSYVDPTSLNHTQGKGATTDNVDFERTVRETGVDGVFLAHIKGQFLYSADNIPYYIDGGAGGELYTTGPVGADHGYWHGYRLIRVDGGRIETDTVPIFVKGGISVTGPDRMNRGQIVRFEGFGRQPVFNNKAKVEALELRDPDPRRPGGAGASGALMLLVWIGGPLAAVALLVFAARARPARPRTRVRLGGAVAGGLLVVSTAGAVAIAQQSEPTTTPKESLPVPARIWTTSDRLVLSPVAVPEDDPRRDARTQTDGGKFKARCPGRAKVEIASGWESRAKRVTVPSATGPILRKVSRRASSVRRGRKTKVAAVFMAQPGRVVARVRSGTKTIATIAERCVGGRSLSVHWNGAGAKRGRTYTVEFRILSDRATTVRKFSLLVR